MPVVNVYMWPREKEEKRKLARAVTDAFVRIGNVPPEAVTVIFHDIKKENWAQGGYLSSEAK